MMLVLSMFSLDTHVPEYILSVHSLVVHAWICRVALLHKQGQCLQKQGTVYVEKKNANE